MKRSIALAQETNSPPASDESGLGNGTENNTAQPGSEYISAPAQASASQRKDKPERKRVTGKIKRNELSKRESSFMPAMSIEAALARHAAMVEFTRRIMVRNQDFGDIQGAHKPALLKPGAEKLCSFFGLEPEFTPLAEEIDWTGSWHEGEIFCYVRYRCRLLRDGRILGVGEGSCNSWESRYRYRWVPTEQVPEFLDRSQMLKRGGQRTVCEFEFAIDRAETTGVYGKPAEYWQKLKEAIAAGTARRIERDSRQGKLPAWEFDADTTLYRIPNPDVADLVNTIQKMAQKRALVAATLIATAASEFFTQDVEDIPAEQGVFATVVNQGALPPGTNTSEAVVGLSSQRKPVASANCSCQKPWKNFGEMRRFFAQLREEVGETRYLEEMEIAGVTSPSQFRSSQQAMECYSRLLQIAAEPEVA
jgi:hypothetical protein